MSVFNLATGESQTVLAEDGEIMQTALDYPYLAWATQEIVDQETRLWTIRTMDLTSSSDPTEIATTVISSDGSIQFAIDYPHVYWGIGETGGDGMQEWSIWTMDTASDNKPSQIGLASVLPVGSIQILAEADTAYWITYDAEDSAQVTRTRSREAPEQFYSADEVTRMLIYREMMVIGTAGHLVLHNLATGEELRIGEGDTYTIAMDGRYIFWAPGGLESDTIFGYDMLTNARFKVWEINLKAPALPGSITTVSVADGVIVWDHVGYEINVGRSTIYGTSIEDRLPSADRPDPETTNPDWTYYPETGHYLANEFREFWNDSGGLPVFGYPMTEEFDYLSPETGNAHAAQMTERQRFEWHPENIGTPYAVLLGRLGETILAEQGRDWTTFEKADPSADHYFEATGHAIAPEFYDYWAGHGLDLGHAGVSFDESLALFGYPLSEPMMETNADGDTVLTQYFERAVFEHHPDNPEASQVLLRRLGAELMESWGW